MQIPSAHTEILIQKIRLEVWKSALELVSQATVTKAIRILRFEKHCTKRIRFFYDTPRFSHLNPPMAV